MSSLEVMNPTAEPYAGNVGRIAARPKTLAGARLGLLWNGKRGGDIALGHVSELLSRQYQGLQIKDYPGAFPCDEGLLLRAVEECDVIVAASAD